MENQVQETGGTQNQPPWIEGLNKAQLEAVQTLEGPVLILAGAGTGKTRALTARLAQLLYTQKARPYEILCVTFTNRAAREMKERTLKLAGPVAQSIWLGTFHALATRILRRHATLMGLESNFTILDTDDQIRLLKAILIEQGIDEKRWPARMLIHVISRLKDKGLTPENVSPSDVGELAQGKLIDVYKRYQERLKTVNAADFGDLLLHCVTLFKEHRDILEIYQNRFRYILVDEYQDTNVVQYLWLRLLARKHKNLCCVGDDDQSIYGWRGAEVENILRFEKDFPTAKIIRLERNYRSTGHILGAASTLIDHNQGRLGKTLWTEDDLGQKVHISGVWDGQAEARQVGEAIEDLQRQKVSLSEIGILVRTGFQTREFEERLITLGIPFKVLGGPRFYERAEIRDALAYLRLIHQPRDDLAFERIINTPTRGIGMTTRQSLQRVARTLNVSLYQACQGLLKGDDLRLGAKKALQKIIDLFETWREMATHVKHPELMQKVLNESGYVAMLKQSKKPDAPGRIENLKELATAMEGYETLETFLEHVSLVMENEQQNNWGQEWVHLMTLHVAKGLEFDAVFLPGWEEDLFPHQRSLEESGLKGLEEERRLAYVGLTRARKRAFISFAANRRMHGKWRSALPSRFIGELDKKHIEAHVEAGLTMGHNTRQTCQGGASSWANEDTHSLRRYTQKSLDVTQHFEKGALIHHEQFGPGVVVEVDGSHLTIDFEMAGRKKVMAAFVEKRS